MFLKHKCLVGTAIAALLWVACQQEPPPPPRQKVPVSPPVSAIGPERTFPSNLDKSPLDVIYFPVDYPVLKMAGRADAEPLVRLIYSRPSKSGRPIFGNLIKYDEYWRLGANEATEIEFFTNVTVNGKKVKKGRYILYCIPSRDKWTLKLNGDLYTWGLTIHAEKDLYSFEVPVIISDMVSEVLTMKFVPADDGAQLLIAWDKVRAVLPIEF